MVEFDMAVIEAAAAAALAKRNEVVGEYQAMAAELRATTEQIAEWQETLEATEADILRFERGEAPDIEDGQFLKLLDRQRLYTAKLKQIQQRQREQHNRTSAAGSAMSFARLAAEQAVNKAIDAEVQKVKAHWSGVIGQGW
jgi:hypothetical protein